MKPPPGYVPENAAQASKLQAVLNELIQEISKTMRVPTDSAPRKNRPREGGELSNLTLNSGGASQHQAMVVTNSDGQYLYWDANGSPEEGTPLHPTRYNTKLCADCYEYYLDAPQLAAIKNEKVEDNIVILNGGKDWGVRDKRGVVSKSRRDELVPPKKAQKGVVCMRPRLYSGLNSTSPHAELIKRDDVTGGACAEWSLIFAVALKRFLSESGSANSAIAKWTGFQRKLFKAKRVEHNWAIQLVRRDLLWRAHEVNSTIYSIMDSPLNPAKWTNHEIRKLSSKTPLGVKNYFLEKGVWPVVLDVVYSVPEVIIEPSDDILGLEEALQTVTIDSDVPRGPRRSTRTTKFSRFGRRISAGHAYHLYTQGVEFGFRRTGPVVDLTRAYTTFKGVLPVNGK